MDLVGNRVSRSIDRNGSADSFFPNDLRFERPLARELEFRWSLGDRKCSQVIASLLAGYKAARKVNTLRRWLVRETVIWLWTVGKSSLDGNRKIATQLGR